MMEWLHIRVTRAATPEHFRSQVQEDMQDMLDAEWQVFRASGIPCSINKFFDKVDKLKPKKLNLPPLFDDDLDSEPDI